MNGLWAEFWFWKWQTRDFFLDLYIRESPYSSPRKNTKHMPFLQVLNGILWAMRMSATPSVGNALGMITISQIIRVRTVCLKIRFFLKKITAHSSVSVTLQLHEVRYWVRNVTVLKEMTMRAEWPTGCVPMHTPVHLSVFLSTQLSA